MADQENFLERWSRRKREVTPSTAAPDPQRPPDDAAADAPSETLAGAATPRDLAKPSTKTAASEPAFDLSKLPSLDSITATTDIRPFLARGVPSELTRAALRRAWEADPAIRNFVGLQENDWDFNNPNAIAGFGDLPPGTDLKQMVARLFGEAESAAETAPASDRLASTATEPPQIPQPIQAPADTSPATLDARAQAPDVAEPNGAAASAGEPVVEQAEFVQDSKNIATQNKNSTRRKHGSALPE